MWGGTRRWGSLGSSWRLATTRGRTQKHGGGRADSLALAGDYVKLERSVSGSWIVKGFKSCVKNVKFLLQLGALKYIKLGCLTIF